MTPSEIVLLVRYVRALCPGQRMDEYTPDAWQDVLAGLDLDDARCAVAALACRQVFIAPAEIIAEVRRVRAARLAAEPEPAPDADLDPAGYIAALRAGRRWVAAGGPAQRQLVAPSHGRTRVRLDHPLPLKAAAGELLAGTSPTPRQPDLNPTDQPREDTR